MSVTFPPGFRCDDIQRELYPQVEARVRPLLERHARRVRRVIPLDEAMQHGRMAILRALLNYDVNHGADALDAYIGTVLSNTFSKLFNKATRRCRLPRTSQQNAAGEWYEVYAPPMPMSALQPRPGGEQGPREPFEARVVDAAASADGELIELQSQAEVDALVACMREQLTGRAREVFDCKVNPPPELLVLVRNLGGAEDEPPSNKAIQQWLGISKNTADWCLERIRKLCVEMAHDGGFSDLFETLITRSWVRVHAHAGTMRDAAFIQEVLTARRLDPRPLPDFHAHPDFDRTVGIFRRRIERYTWGSVVVVEKDGEVHTLVVEGRFKARSGEAVGPNGTRCAIPVDWYGQLVRAFDRARREG